MKKKLSFTVLFGCLIFLYGCSQFSRSDPDPLYFCIDSFPTSINELDTGTDNNFTEKQLEAIEFCLKRS